MRRLLLSGWWLTPLAGVAGCIIAREMVPLSCDRFDCTTSCGMTEPHCASPNRIDLGSATGGAPGVDACDPSAPLLRRSDACDPQANLPSDPDPGSDPAMPILWDGGAELAGVVPAQGDEWIRYTTALAAPTFSVLYANAYDGVMLGAYLSATATEDPLASGGGPDGAIDLTVTQVPRSGVLYLRIRNSADCHICYQLTVR